MHLLCTVHTVVAGLWPSQGDDWSCRSPAKLTGFMYAFVRRIPGRWRSSYWSWIKKKLWMSHEALTIMKTLFMPKFFVLIVPYCRRYCRWLAQRNYCIGSENRFPVILSLTHGGDFSFTRVGGRWRWRSGQYRTTARFGSVFGGFFSSFFPLLCVGWIFPCPLPWNRDPLGAEMKVKYRTVMVTSYGKISSLEEWIEWMSMELLEEYSVSVLCTETEIDTLCWDTPCCAWHEHDVAGRLHSVRPWMTGSITSGSGQSGLDE